MTTTGNWTWGIRRLRSAGCRRLLVAALLAGCFGSGALQAGAVPSDAFSLHPALEIELFVAEPDVVDPVALTFDADGRLYVVEMRDYPEGVGPDRRPGGTVRLLEDTTGDGRIDRATLFAEDLSFPTSIAPWRGGVLVTAPPDILFLKDTTGDGRADVRRVVLTGFRLGVTDSNVNGLRWGLDNRVHGANGGNGGRVHAPGQAAAAVDIRGRDFSFDPDSGEWSTTYHTGAGFGLVFDEWGRSFTTYNIRHIQHRVLPVRYLERFTGFPPVNPILYISDHSDSGELPSYAQGTEHGLARIYPVSTPVTRPNHPEQAGHFSAAGGIGFIGWSGYPGDLYGSVLVCDVVGNLVHRDVLTENGPTFIASRSADELEREFLAGRENWFRPVGVEAGPDGALYVIDMQRGEIEHPDYIPEKLKAELNLRAGEDRGRIFRLTPKGGLPPRRPRLEAADSSTLIGHLDDEQPWWRTTAQRLLFERQDPAVLLPLRKAIATASPLGRLHILWTLHGLNGLDATIVRTALEDSHPGVRENAVQIAETRLGAEPELVTSLIALRHDPHPRVRFQLALTLGEIEHPETPAALLAIARRDVHHRWSGLAVLSSLREGTEGVFVELLDDIGSASEPDAVRLQLIRDWSGLVAARTGNDSAAIEQLIARLIGPGLKRPWKLALLEGLAQGFRVGGRAGAVPRETLEPLTRLDASEDLELSYRFWSLMRTLGLETENVAAALDEARRVAVDPEETLSRRTAAVRLFEFARFAQVQDLLVPLLDGRQPGAIQQAALSVLERFDEPDVGRQLMSRWRELGPSTRSALVQVMLRRASFHGELLEALETERVTVGELNLDLEQRRRLLRHSRPEIQARAARWFGDEEYGHRKELVDDWLVRLPDVANREAGRAVYEQSCASCHTLRGTGYAVGPDLSNSASRSVEDLVSNILDPNMAIHPNYATYLVVLDSGELETGILHSESAESVVLLQAYGRQLHLPRRSILRFESTALSLMPEGLEGGWTPQDLRDLIAYLQAGD
jgi:putative membrane-bound dehydrogenase-like protein